MLSVDGSTPTEFEDMDDDSDDLEEISNLAAAKKEYSQAVYWVRFPRPVPLNGLKGPVRNLLTIHKGLNNPKEHDLSTYCKKSEGIDILILTFLSNLGSGKPPSGSIHGCKIDGTSNVSNQAACKSIAKGIKACQSRGKKVFISLGGGGAGGAVTSKADAEAVGKALWNQYGDGSGGGPRPFGKAVVNGFDLDVESSSSANNLRYLVSELRRRFKTDKNKKRKYYISGAPQSPTPEKNLGDVIKDAKLDYLFIQFYNNDYCSAFQAVRPESGQGNGFNFQAWEKLIKGTKSAKAKLLVSLPAGRKASTGDDKGSK